MSVHVCFLPPHHICEMVLQSGITDGALSTIKYLFFFVLHSLESELVSLCLFTKIKLVMFLRRIAITSSVHPLQLIPRPLSDPTYRLCSWGSLMARNFPTCSE